MSQSAREGTGSIVLTLCILLILALPIVITAFFAIEMFTGLVAAPARAPIANNAGSMVIVIPAHDEEAVIGATVKQVLAQAESNSTVLVVADNCVDRTAEEARSAGAKVLVRNDPDRRGKGYALAAAADHLRGDAPDVVIVLDADCRIDRNSLRALAAACICGRPGQAVNLLSPDLAGPPLVQLSTFAFMVKNLVRQRGLQTLAGRAHLTGTGMALPWRLFASANLGGSNIVEDLALGLELAERASAPILVSEATVWSPPASQGGTLVQRRRWEGGYIATAIKTVPAALGRALRRGDVRAVIAALDLSIPPLALLVLINALALGLALLAVVAGASIWPVLIQLLVGTSVAAAVIVAWIREGRRFASAGTLLRLPFYVLWKLPMYVGLARGGAPKEWLRTGR